jgi:topoisomerase IA-like protein
MSKKSRIIVILSVEQIREMFVLGDKYILFADFFKRVVATPINSLNNSKECNIRVETASKGRTNMYIKDGKKVIAIRFEVTYKDMTVVESLALTDERKEKKREERQIAMYGQVCIES